MRVAFFSPMPPSKSGIADYSAAVASPLSRLVDLHIFPEKPSTFDPARYDIALYQLGNNPYHGFVYEAALEHPGVVVMHESNLHHLIADLTIKRGDWEAYLRECEYNGEAQALVYARRVRALEVGPDYEGLPMTRRILERSRALIVHSRFVFEQMRAAGFAGPIARIPHGAWIPQADRWAYRQRLGLDESTPLIGIFGFLKPYKRIPESLRAFRRLLRLEPRAKMILAGELHPEVPLHSLVSTLGLSANLRTLGFLPMQDFTGYLAACDIVLNLRYPTVGESSGSLLRALGLGRAVLVSDVGAFREFPDDVCLKVPVDATEEDLIFEYLNLLVSRPQVAQALGRRARQWVEQECNWELVAQRYAAFLQSVADGTEWPDPTIHTPQSTIHTPQSTIHNPPPSADYILGWAAPGEAQAYAAIHLSRLEKTLAITPPGGPEDRILEMGAYLQITPALKTRLGYGQVRACYYGPLGKVDHREVTSLTGERFQCDIELFDAEKDSFPYPDEYFTTVLCCELIEHLSEDPMHALVEIHRILKPGGHLVLTTPNIASLTALSAVLQGFHPGFFPQYMRPSPGQEPETRHSREYTPLEIHELLRDAGFSLGLLETGPFREAPKPELAWVRHLLEHYKLSTELRGDGIYALARKTGPVRSRFPSWLYTATTP
jgi:glycosyltransferase involved in cell wall biosynthesis/SAM-dependent methyltransferase